MGGRCTYCDSREDVTTPCGEKLCASADCWAQHEGCLDCKRKAMKKARKEAS